MLSSIKPKHKIIFFFIEGNIGAGKTTIFEKLKKIFINDKSNTNIEYHYLTEPVDEWTKKFKYTGETLYKKVETTENLEIKKQFIEEGDITDYLTLQYNYPQQFFSFFQVIVLLSYYKQFLELYNEINLSNENIIHIVFSDRSPMTMKYIFFDMLSVDYNINEEEIRQYNLMYDCYFTNFIDNYNIIYINTPVFKCEDGIKERNRGGENKITSKFLNKLDRQTHNYIDKCIEKNINIFCYNYFNFNYFNDLRNWIMNIINE